MMIGCEGYRAGLSRVYDGLNAEVDYKSWADFFEECFDRYLEKKPELILDLACGTGSMTLELARRGYDMIGVDGSADMLATAFERAGGAKGLLFLQQDMRGFELYGTVGAVTCCLDSVNYLLSEEDVSKCFATVHNYLDPDGLFLFDVNSPTKFRTVYGNRDYVLEDELPDGRRVLCTWQNDYHRSSGLCDFYLSLFEEKKDGSYARSDEQQTERCYAPETIKKILEQNGFETVGTFSDFRFSAPTKASERLYFVAKAIKN